MTKFLTEARKAAIAGLGVVAQIVALGVLHGTVLHIAQAVLSAATAFGVWRIPNGVAK